MPVKTIRRNLEKNEKLKRERGTTFEEVVYHIEQGDVIDITEHPNQTRYPGQQIYVIRMHEYVYLVPFIETEDEIFLKTIIPSRKAAKEYRHE
jgi:hypothetical protein